MIVCGKPYKETFELYAKELHDIAKPTTTNGKPDREPHSAIEALAKLFDKFAAMEVPFCDLDRFCYFIIQSAAQDCKKGKYCPWGDYGFTLFDCTFEKVFEAKPDLTPNNELYSCLNNLVHDRYGLFSINEVMVMTFIKDFSEEEITSYGWITPEMFRMIKDFIGKLGLSLRKESEENERILQNLPHPIESHP